MKGLRRLLFGRRPTDARPRSAEDSRRSRALGEAALAKGDVAAAIDFYRDAVNADPDGEAAHFALGNALARSGDHEGAAEELREAIRCRADFAAAHCNLGLALHEIGALAQARDSLRRAVELAPDNPDFRANLRIVAGHPVPLWHFSMMNDAPRNDGYEAAIRAVVAPGDRVFEIGTGSGLLAMMAARAGAGHVFACEMVEPLAHKAREIIDANGYADGITVIAKHSAQVSIPGDLPERADVLVAEIIATDLLGEGLLPSFEDAKARLLKPDARIVPRQAWIRGSLVSVSGVESYVRVGNVSGFDLSLFNDFAPPKVHPGEVEMEIDVISQPFDIFHFDFQSAGHFPPQRCSIRVLATRKALCTGILQWIRLDLGGGAVYENADEGLRRAGHWQQVLHFLPEPVPVDVGDNLLLTVAHNRNNLVVLDLRPRR